MRPEDRYEGADGIYVKARLDPAKGGAAHGDWCDAGWHNGGLGSGAEAPGVVGMGRVYLARRMGETAMWKPSVRGASY